MLPYSTGWPVLCTMFSVTARHEVPAALTISSCSDRPLTVPCPWAPCELWYFKQKLEDTPYCQYLMQLPHTDLKPAGCRLSLGVPGRIAGTVRSAQHCSAYCAAPRHPLSHVILLLIHLTPFHLFHEATYLRLSTMRARRQIHVSP